MMILLLFASVVTAMVREPSNVHKDQYTVGPSSNAESVTESAFVVTASGSVSDADDERPSGRKVRFADADDQGRKVKEPVDLMDVDVDDPMDVDDPSAMHVAEGTMEVEADGWNRPCDDDGQPGPPPYKKICDYYLQSVCAKYHTAQLREQREPKQMQANWQGLCNHCSAVVSPADPHFLKNHCRRSCGFC